VTMDIETDGERIRALASAKEDENWRFRAYLKGVDLPDAALDRLVRRRLEEIAPRIDCCACANCCKVVSPLLSHKDVLRLSDCLGVEKRDLIDDYLRPSREKGKHALAQTPCPFLRDQRCSVYDARPDDCRSFPRLHRPGFRSRLIRVIENCSICPIVYNVLERLKSDLRGRRQRS